MNAALKKIREDILGVGERIREAAKGQEVIYIANPGNLGDGLIREGTLNLFNEIGLRYTEIRFEDRWKTIRAVARRPIFIYGGGGAWGPSYSGGLKRARRLAPFAKQLIVLPSSFATHVHRRLSREWLLARDEYESQSFAPTAEFCHDFAFYATLPDIEKTRETGKFFRTDAEQLFNCVPQGNRDISRDGNHLNSLENFKATIGSCSEVCTDRLHVAICALMLGCRVKLYPNNYFKIRAIYDSTLRHFGEQCRLERVPPEQIALT